MREKSGTNINKNDNDHPIEGAKKNLKIRFGSPMLLQLSPPASPLHTPFRRSLKDLLRWVLLTCVLLLTGLTFSNLQYVQRTVDSFEIETLPSLFSASQHFNIVVRNVAASKKEGQNHTSWAASLGPSDAVDDEDDLTCLIHKGIMVNASSNRVSDPNRTILKPINALICGKLRRKWLRNPPLSTMARLLEHHQSNCSLPAATHYFDNTFGLGSHFILWGQALCNALQDNNPVRMHSRSPETWLWLDQTHCDVAQAEKESPLMCYFPKAERRCENQKLHDWGTNALRNVSDPRNKKFHCPLVRDTTTRSMFRAAASEYLFQHVSRLVIQEAKRQVGVIFASNGGKVPEDLITVHIRWGDKFWEMDLPPIQEYIEAVHNLTRLSGHVERTATNSSSPANIYLATEDPKAYEAFMAAKPPEWKVYADITLLEINAFRPLKGNRASWATRNTRGRAGLVALGSLLVAMEANRFVLTTKSNWSTLMDHLRTNIIDPRCGNCTTMIDLRPGEYY